MSTYALGVDLGGTNLRIAAVDESGQLLAKINLETEVTRGREHVVNELCRATLELRARFGAQGLAGIGCGVPGLIDIETGRVVASPNLPGWSEYDVKAEIEQRIGSKVILENDANVAAIGEHWLGAGQGAESMCLYTLGTGVGGGLILDGKLWRGWNGMAGELGHCLVVPDGHPCGCGGNGCLEQYASATAVVRQTRECLERSTTPSQLRGLQPLTSLAIYEAAKAGDPIALEVFETVGRMLGRGMAAVVNTLNPGLFVVGGGVSSGWDAFAPSLFAELRLRSYLYAATTTPEGTGTLGRKRPTVVTRARLGGDAGLFGAARMPLIGTVARV